MKNDAIVDQNFYLSSNDSTYYIDGVPKSIKQLSTKLDIGRMPESDNEIVIAGSKTDYYLGTQYKELMSKEYKIENLFSSLTQNDTKIIK